MSKKWMMAAAVAAVAFAGPSFADKAKFDEACSDCHEAKDFAGKSAADLEKSLKGIVAGTVKHKGKLKLTDAEVKSLAAYLSAGK
jgi:cytochrome c553